VVIKSLVRLLIAGGREGEAGKTQRCRRSSQSIDYNTSGADNFKFTEKVIDVRNRSCNNDMITGA